MSRKLDFADMENCEIQVAIPANWLDPIANSLDLTARALRDRLEEDDEDLPEDIKEAISKLRRYYFSLWTRVDTMAVEFKRMREQPEK